MARRVGTWVAWLGVLGASACGPEPESTDWALQMTPTTHPNQLPFDGGPVARLLLRRSTGDEVVDLGEVREGGELQATGLPDTTAMADVLALGLAIEEPGGEAGAIDLDRLTAYGEAPLDDLAAELPVLVSQVDRIGDLGNLGEAKQRFLRVAGIVPPGKVYLFGGSTELGNPTVGTPNTADIFELESLDAGEPWTFENIGTLTGTSNPPERCSAASSSVVGLDGAPMILITGGREDFWQVGPSYDDWFLWDPATKEIAKKGKLSAARSEHYHVQMANGKVLVAGGWSSTSTGELLGNSADLIDPQAGTIEEIDFLLDGVSGSNGASLGDKGALLCGGFDVPNANAEAVSQCVTINFQGVAQDAAPLPIPLAKFAMAPAGEGRVLVAGGITWAGPQDAGSSFAAVNDAFLYDAGSDSWTEVNPLNDPRSAAVGIPLANGRVLIVGGTSSDGVFLLPDSEVQCPEVYDPETATFARLDDQCGSWGAGAAPPVAQWPGLGTVLLKGYTVDEEPQDAVGFLGAEPISE